MEENRKIKLSAKEYEIMETIRRDGEYKVDNCQNRSVKNLIAKGLCDFNSGYNALVFTSTGKEFQL